ncbi:MAG: hypothetical protein U0796_07715 [Gemmatales bacterium]
MSTHRKTINHYNIPGHAHYLTFSTYRRIPLLNKDRTRLWLIESIERARKLHDFDLWKSGVQDFRGTSLLDDVR